MSYIESFKKLGQNILDLVFPISCLVCGADGVFLCAQCSANLPRLEKQICLACGKPSPFGKRHPDCVTRNVADGTISALTYKNKNVDNIIRTFKYNFVSDLSEPLANLIVETINKEDLSDYFQEFTIIPVPLHQKRQNWRGFNQAQLLAEQLSKHLGIKVNNEIVSRSKFTKPQTTLSVDERKKNIQNAFTLTGQPDGKKYLLIDDVITTGSTINEITKLLKQNNATEVWAVSVAHG